MRKYKNFRRWVFTTKLNIPPKDKHQVKEQVATHPQQQASIKMLDAPFMYKVCRSFLFLRCLGSDADLCSRIPFG